MGLKDLKNDMKKRNKEKLEDKQGGQEVDERFYLPSVDAEGRINVKVRFIPSFVKDEDGDVTAIESFVKVKFHNVSECGKEKRWMPKTKCPKSIGKECPICDHGWGLFNDGKESGLDAKKAIIPAKKWLSDDKFVTNIIVIEDKEKPENEGKTFLFEFGKAILNNINAQTNPENSADNEYIDEETDVLDDGATFDGWDLDESFIFRLNRTAGKKKTNGKGWEVFPKWSKSKFIITECEEFDEDVQEEIVEGAYSLNEFKDEEKFPTKEFLETKLKFLTYQTDEKSDEEDDKKKALESSESTEEEQEEEKPVEKKAPVKRRTSTKRTSTKPKSEPEPEEEPKEPKPSEDEIDVDDLNLDDIDEFLK